MQSSVNAGPSLRFLLTAVAHNTPLVPVQQVSVTNWSSTVPHRCLASPELWPTRCKAPHEKTVPCHRSSDILLCSSNSRPTATPLGSAAVAIAPVQGQVFLESDPRIESVRPVQPQVGPKNDRLFFIIPNYLTVENRDQVEPLSAKTKFKLSAKTMSDPVTISFIGVIALIGQARNSDPS